MEAYSTQKEKACLHALMKMTNLKTNIFILLLTVSVGSSLSLIANAADSLGSGQAYIAQQTDNQQIDVTGKLGAAADGSGWEIVTTSNQIYHIENPQQWKNQDWFDSGATIRIVGYVLPNTAKSTIVASQITHVKVSEVKTTGDRVRDEIRNQVDKQTSGDKIDNLLKKIPFLKKWFGK